MNKEQIEAPIAEARSAIEEGFLVGHVKVQKVGEDLHFLCTVCQNAEVVRNFQDGDHAQKFVFQPIRTDGREYVKCETCGKVHDRVVPFAR